MQAALLSTPKVVYAVSAVAALGGLLFGYDTGVISGAILFIQPEFGLGATMEEVVVSTVLVGAALGAAAGGLAGDRWGRRRTIVVAGVVFALGSAVCAAAPDVWTLIAGRIVVGASIGVASFIVPLYIAEVAPTRMRGRLVSLNQLAVTSGIVVAYGVDYAFAPIKGWREMFAVAVLPAAGLVVGMLLLPPSPRWLAGRGATDRARQVLRRLRGGADVDAELAEIHASLAEQQGGWRELARPAIRPALAIGVALAVLQQVTGINTVIYYAPTIARLAGVASNSAALLATLGVGVVNVALTMVAIGLLDRVGRRPLLLGGLAGMVASLALIGAAFRFPQLFGGQGALLALLGLGLYVGAFAVGLGPVFWLLISEIYPLRVRGLAMSFATVANWSANLLVALTFLSLVGAAGRGPTFWLYAALSLGALAFAWLYVPETKGRTLEQIEAHWRAGRHPLAL